MTKLAYISVSNEAMWYLNQFDIIWLFIWELQYIFYSREAVEYKYLHFIIYKTYIDNKYW